MLLNFIIYQNILIFYYYKSVTIQNRGQLVGNFINDIKLKLQYYYQYKSSSETIYEDSNLKPISDHIAKFKKYYNDNEFGYYLAGLIEGNGHFNKMNEQIISFNIKDTSSAYYIKKMIGFGSIKINQKSEGQQTINLVISSRIGIIRVLFLINGKMRTEQKFNQLNSFIYNFNYSFELLPLDKSSILNNSWQAGFVDANGYFKINRKNAEIRQSQQIDQKHKQIQNVIKNEFHGKIGYRSKLDTYYYNSISFGVAKKYIEYFNTYNLMSNKYIDYLKWRKTYRQDRTKKDRSGGQDKTQSQQIGNDLSYNKES